MRFSPPEINAWVSFLLFYIKNRNVILDEVVVNRTASFPQKQIRNLYVQNGT